MYLNCQKLIINKILKNKRRLPKVFLEIWMNF